MSDSASQRILMVEDEEDKATIRRAMRHIGKAADRKSRAAHFALSRLLHREDVCCLRVK